MQAPHQDIADIYRIQGSAAAWRIEHNDEVGTAYATKEAAFEAAVASASGAIRAGHRVVIEVPAAGEDEPAVCSGDMPDTPWSSLS